MWSAVVAGSRQDEPASCTGLSSLFDKNYATNSLYVLIIKFIWDFISIISFICSLEKVKVRATGSL